LYWDYRFFTSTTKASETQEPKPVIEVKRESRSVRAGTQSQLGKSIRDYVEVIGAVVSTYFGNWTG
jgi:hypothetical protein